MKRTSIKALHKLLRGHGAAMALAPDSHHPVYEFHNGEYHRIWKELKDRYKEKVVKPLDPAVEAARNARWQHYGRIGQLRWAQTALTYIGTGYDAEVKGLAEEIEQKIIQLINLLGTRKSSQWRRYLKTQASSTHAA